MYLTGGIFYGTEKAYRYIGVVKLVDYGSTTCYKSGEVLTAAKKRENAKMEKRIAAVKEEMQSDEAVSA